MFPCAGFVPRGYSETRAWPLLVAVPRQGVSSAETLTWWQREAARHGYILAVVDTLNDQESPFDFSATAHQRLLACVRRLKLGLSVNDDRVVIAGHGVGGDMAMDVASNHPDVFAGVVSLAALGRRHLQWSARNSPDLGWYVVVGGRQNLLHAQMNGLLTRLFQRSRETKQYNNALFSRYPERGFESFHEELPTVFEWLRTCLRTSHPKQVNARMMRSSDTSWHWLEFRSIPRKYQTLEQPVASDDAPSDGAFVSAEIGGNNSISIGRLPDDVFVKLSPDLPDIDVSKPVLIRAGGKTRRVDFNPSVRDLLEEYRRTGDHIRLLSYERAGGEITFIVFPSSPTVCTSPQRGRSRRHRKSGTAKALLKWLHPRVRQSQCGRRQSPREPVPGTS